MATIGKFWGSLLEKCLIVDIFVLRKCFYYWKHLAQNFPIVETSFYYWKRGKGEGQAG
jgi:hypothetical protein